LNYGPAVTLEL